MVRHGNKAFKYVLDIAVIDFNDVSLNMFFPWHGGYAFTSRTILLSGIADESKFLVNANYKKQAIYNRLTLESRNLINLPLEPI